MQHVGDELVVHFEHVAVHAAHEVADLAFARALDALQHHVLRAVRDERVDELLGRVVGDVGAGPLALEDNGGLGQVRREHVGVARQVGHGAAELGRVGGIHLAVVGHDRVDHAQRAGVGGVDVADDVDLLRRAQEARVHGVDFHVDALPSCQVVGKDGRRVVHVPTGEGRVRAEEARGHGAHVGARRRQHGNGHAERALAVTAQVVDRRDAGDVVAFALVQDGSAGVLRHRHGLSFRRVERAIPGEVASFALN